MLRQLIRLRHGFSKIDGTRSTRLVRFNSSAQMQVKAFSSELMSSWPTEIKNFLAKENISQPTLIQEKTLPAVMENKDVVGIARTGSGKTLAFVIPAVMKILKAREEQEIGNRKPTCLVLAPTRELATQTKQVFDKFRNLGIKSLILVGGASRSAQVQSIETTTHDAYIATPGRLNDLIDSNLVDLSNIRYLVLDEADRMLDMGFEPQIRRVLEKIPRDRQTVMWSATWPSEIQSLAMEFMKEYEYVAVDGEKLKANPNIEQKVIVCEPREKLELLLRHLKTFREESEKPRVLLFVNTKRMAETLVVRLMSRGHRSISMHGDRSQRQRDDALRLFKNGLCNIMIATDVAARGLDINDITHVFNFDFPNNMEDYVHRIGRTARHNKRGVAVSLVTSHNANIAKKLIHVLKETNQSVPEELRRLASTSAHSFVFR